MKICEECGSDGEGGAIEYSDGTIRHFRKFPEGPLAKPLPLMCAGKFVEVGTILGEK